MAANSKDLIARAFIDLVVQEGFCNVTIEAICKKAFSSKRTFYRHFRDKSDVAGYIFWLSVSKPAIELVRHLPPMQEGEQNRIVMLSVFRNLEMNRPFWRSLVLHGRDISIEEVLEEGIQPFLSAMNSRSDSESTWFRYSKRFFIGGYCRSLVMWLIDDSNDRPTADEMADLYADLFMRFWKDQLNANFPLWTKNLLDNTDYGFNGKTPTI